MKDRPAYIALRQAVIDNNYTIQQVKNATIAQAAQLAGVDKSEIVPYFEGMKRNIIGEMQVAIEQTKIDAVKSQVKSWLDNNFPQHVIEHDIVNGKPEITIWPEGKP